MLTKQFFKEIIFILLLVVIGTTAACGSNENAEWGTDTPTVASATIALEEATASTNDNANGMPSPEAPENTSTPAASPEGNNAPAATPDLSDASLTADVAAALPGDAVSLTGAGFPSEAIVEIGLGPLASEYSIIETTQADENGRFTIQLSIHDNTEPGQWVYVAEVDNGKVTADPITVRADNQFTRTQIYLVALEDNGQSGQKIGCSDSLVPIEINIEPTNAPLTAALEQLLHPEAPYYGQSGLYNAFYQSDLSIDGIDIENEQATIALSGTLIVGGVCDTPRIRGQLEQTALQYNTISSVDIFLNGEPLEVVLSTQ